MKRAFILSIFPLTLSGCVTSVVGAAVSVVTLPIKAAGAAVDAATTSQAEADQKRGRELRKQEEERGRHLRETQDRCRKGKPLPTDDCGSLQQH